MSGDDHAEFVLELINKVTGPVEDMLKSLGASEKAVSAVSGAMQSLGNQAQSSLGKVGEMGNSLMKSFAQGGAMGAGIEAFKIGVDLGKEALSKLAEAAEWAVDKIIEGFEKAIEKSDEFRNEIFAMNAALGNDGGAEMIEKLDKMSDRLAMGRDQTKGIAIQLLKAGFKDEQMPQMLAMMSDLVARNGGNTGVADQIAAKLMKIQATGKVGGKDLMAFAKAGINIDAIATSLAEMNHMSLEEAKKLLQHGKVKSDDAIAAIQAAVAKGSGGTLGALGEKFELGSFKQQMQKLKDFWNDLFKGNDLHFITDFLNRLNESLRASEGVKRLVATFERLFSVVTSALGAADGSDMTSVIDGIADAVGAAMTWIVNSIMSVNWAEIWEGAKKVGAAIGDVFKAASNEKGGAGLGGLGKDLAQILRILAASIEHVAKLISSFERLNSIMNGSSGGGAAPKGGPGGPAPGAPTAGGEASAPGVPAGVNGPQNGGALNGAGQAMGTAFGTGLAAGIDASGGAVDGAVGNMTKNVITKAKKDLEVHSPSEVFKDIGYHVGEGFVIGLDNVDTKGAMGKAVKPPDFSGVGATVSAGASGNGGGVSITIELNVTGDPKDAEALMHEAQRTLLPALASAAEQLAIERGAE